MPVYVAAQRYQAGLIAETAATETVGLKSIFSMTVSNTASFTATINILLLDSRDLHDHLLPAGNLREPLRAMQRATILAIPADNPELELKLKTAGWNGPVWRLRRRMDVPHTDAPS